MFINEGTTPIAVWVLEREDGFIKVAKESHWIEFNENGQGKARHDKPAIGYSCLLGPIGPFFVWQTTAVEEILEETEKTVKFRTKNSTYTLTYKD